MFYIFFDEVITQVDTKVKAHGTTDLKYLLLAFYRL